MKNILLLIIALSLFSFSNCKKYEEGPSFSLRTKKNRLTGNWNLISWENQNTASFIDKIEIKKEGGFEWKLTKNSNQNNSVFIGTWRFTKNKEQVELKYDNGNIEDYIIIMLENNNMKWEDKAGNKIVFEQ